MYERTCMFSQPPYMSRGRGNLNIWFWISNIQNIFLITNNLNRMIGITHIFEYPYFLNNSYKMFDIMDKMLSFFMTE